MDFPRRTQGEIETAVDSLRFRALGVESLQSAKVDLERIVFDYLSEIESLIFDDESELGSQGDEVILGRTYPVRGRIEINRILKRSGSEGRYRFTLAHEIGHWVLHRPLFVAETMQPSLFGAAGEQQCLVSLNRAVFPGRRHRKVAPEEWQANRFAAHLLIQRELLREEFSRRFGEPPIALRSAGWRPRSSTATSTRCCWRVQSATDRCRCATCSGFRKMR
jgi:hypothetical protein